MSVGWRWLSAVCAFAFLLSFATAPEPARASDQPGDPVVVVLDISGSMADDDGNGIHKIDAARRSVQGLIRSAGAGGVFGLWAYPTGGICSAGEYVIPPGPITNVDAAIAQVEKLEPGGSTPTGTALAAAVAELSAKGFDRATIVLVSDGESNCGPPPCVVAQNLASTGFQVTVDAVGFQQSEAGRKELECIANATGGTYFDARDSEKFVEHFLTIGQPKLAVSVSSPTVVTVGTSATIKVTVTNPSIKQVDDVRANLSFLSGAKYFALPAVVPPTWLLGNLPAGGSVSRSWAVSFGDFQGTDTTEANFRVRAWAKSAEGAASGGRIMISTLLPTKSDLGGVLAGVRDNGLPLVIAGDSFSAGEGAGDYLSNATGSVDQCHRSLKTYFGSLLQDHPDQLKIVACSGAVTNNIDTSQHSDGFGSVSQVDQIKSIPNPGAVLLTLGGNDAQFADIAKNCMGEADCTADTLLADASTALIPGVKSKTLPGGRIIPLLGENLADSYRRLWLSANTPDQVAKRGGQHAPVIVLGYPMILHDSQYGVCKPSVIGMSGIAAAGATIFSQNFSTAEVAYLNNFEQALNSKIAESVKTVADQGYEVYFAGGDVPKAFRPEHSACEARGKSYTTPITVTSINPTETTQDSLHPNSEGYRATTAALMSWLGTSVGRITPNTKLIEQHLPVESGAWNPAAGLLATTKVDLDARTAQPQIALSTRVEIRGKGFAPDAMVAIQLHSFPRYLGSLQADHKGLVAGTIAIPGDVPAGEHILSAEGFGMDGSYLVKQLRVSVTPQFPLGIAAIGVLGLLAIFAGVTGVLIGWVKGRKLRGPRGG